MDPWKQAVKQFESTLTVEEKVIFANAHPEDIVRDVSKIEETQRKSSKLRRISLRIQPLFDTISDYGKALDVLANTSSIIPPIWGSLRVVLLIAQNYNDYFSKLIDFLERIGDVLPRYSTYAKLFSFHAPLQSALQAVFLQMIVFLTRTRTTITKSPFRKLLNITLRSFDREFEVTISQMRRYRELVEDEAKLASIIAQNQEYEKAQEERDLTTKNREKVEKLEIIAGEQKRGQAMRWLDARKCSEERTLMDESRLHGSCEWILERDELSSWTQDPTTQILLLHGPPGCGKSYLYSRLIEFLERERPVMYFLFCGGDKERITLTSLLRSWTLQLLEHFPETFECLERLKNVNNNPRATDHEIKDLLEALLERVPHCYLTVDALDECSDRDQFFKKLVFIPKHIKILVTSRTPANTHRDLFRVRTQILTLEVHPELSQPDIERFITSSIDTAELSHNEHTVSQIRTRLLRCDGMFLWVKLMIDHLQSQTCEYDMLRCLEELPEGLSETYANILERINKLSASRRALAHKVFFWGITLRRPVSVAEMRTLLAIQPTLDSFDERRLVTDAESVISTVCGGLIQYRGADRKIFFTHFTVTEYLQQYLLQEETLQEIMASYDIRELGSNDALASAVCLRYLCYQFVQEIEPPMSFLDVSGIITRDDARFSLLSYATNNWFVHLGAIHNEGSLVSQLVLQFLKHRPSHLKVAWHLFWFSDPRSLESVICPSQFSGLHVVAYFGLSKFVDVLLDENSLSLRDSRKRSPLWWAASRGHAEVAGILMEAGFDPDAPDSQSITAVHRATAIGSLEVFEMILAHTEESDSVIIDSEGWTPLHWAASQGHNHVIAKLFCSYPKSPKYGADLPVCHIGRTPLHLAALKGHKAVVWALSGHARWNFINAQDKNGYTALHLAAMQGHDDVVEALLALGADSNLLDQSGKSAAQKALAMGNERLHSRLQIGTRFDEREASHQIETLKTTRENIAKYGMISFETILSERDAIVHPQDTQDLSILNFIMAGHHGMFELSMKKRRRWRVWDKRGRTTLHYSAALGYISMMRLILKMAQHDDDDRAFVDRQDDRGWTALHYAVEGRFPFICKLLIENGSSTDIQNADSLTAYDTAIREEHQATIEALAKYALLPSERIAADFGWEAVHIRARDGALTKDDMESMDPKQLETIDRFGRTPLYRALEMKRYEVARMLAEQATLTQGNILELAILAEENGGDDELLQFLIEKLDTSSLQSATEPQRLTQHLFTKVIKQNNVRAVAWLCDIGVDMNDCVDLSEGRTPTETALCVAICNSASNVALLLTERGADISAKDKKGCSMLFLACQHLLVDVVESLLKHGADPTEGFRKAKAPDWLGDSPLHLALSTSAFAKSFEDAMGIARLLLQYGASLSSQYYSSAAAWTALRTLDFSAHKHAKNAVIQLLNDNGCEMLVQIDDEKTGFAPIHTAAAANDVEALKRQLELGVPANWKTLNWEMKYPLLIAAERDNLEAAKLLIEHGADVGWSARFDRFNRFHDGQSKARQAMARLLMQEVEKQRRE